MAEFVPLPCSYGSSVCCSNRLHDFPAVTPRCYKDAFVNSLFPYTVRLWSSLSPEHFPL